MAKIRILLIDDDQIILDMLQISFQKLDPDLVIIPAISGEVGLTLLHTEKPDIVMTNIRMPGMDGFQVIEEIRRVEVGGTRTPIIVLTAHRQDKMRAYAEELGADLYLTKPISPEKLVEHIRAVDAQRQAGHHPPTDAVQ